MGVKGEDLKAVGMRVLYLTTAISIRLDQVAKSRLDKVFHKARGHHHILSNGGSSLYPGLIVTGIL